MFCQKLFSAALVASAATAAAIILSSAPAFADVVFSDLNPGETPGSSSLAVTGSGFTFNGVGQAFTSSGNFNLTEIGVALVQDIGTGSATVALATLNGTTVGPALMSWALSNLPRDTGSPVALSANQIITGITGIELLAGQAYLLEVLPGTSGTYLHWDGNRSSSADFYLEFSAAGPFMDLGTGEGVQGGFEILGNAVTTAVPEPASLALFGGGLLGLLGLRRRRTAALA